MLLILEEVLKSFQKSKTLGGGTDLVWHGGNEPCLKASYLANHACMPCIHGVITVKPALVTTCIRIQRPPLFKDHKLGHVPIVHIFRDYLYSKTTFFGPKHGPLIHAGFTVLILHYLWANISFSKKLLKY